LKKKDKAKTNAVHPDADLEIGKEADQKKKRKLLMLKWGDFLDTINKKCHNLS